MLRARCGRVSARWITRRRKLEQGGRVSPVVLAGSTDKPCRSFPICLHHPLPGVVVCWRPSVRRAVDDLHEVDSFGDAARTSRRERLGRREVARLETCPGVVRPVRPH